MTGRTCNHGTAAGPCGASPAHLYSGGWRCDEHSPAVLAGRSGPVRPAAALPARWTVDGQAVTLASGVLAVNGRQVAADVQAADVVVMGGRLYVGGRAVADLAAAS